MGVKTEFHNAGVHAGRFGDAFTNAFKPSTHKANAANKAAQGAAELIETKTFGAGLFRLATTPFRWGLKLVEFPFTLGMKAVNGGMGMATNAFTKAPGKSLAVTGVVAAVGAGTWLARHNAKKLQAQGEAVEQLTAMQGAAPQVSYKNSVSADEMAAMNERLVADRPASQQAALAARQQSADASPAPAPL